MTNRRFDLFIVDTNGTISHKSGNGDHWTNNWTPLPGNIRFKHDPAVIAYPAFRLNVFAVGSDNQLFYRWREGPTSNWQPQEWESLGGICISKPLAIVSRNVLYVFVLGTNNALWSRNWDGSRWSNFESLGGILRYLPTAHVYPGGICLYTLGMDQSVYHKWGERNGWHPNGTAWFHMGGRSPFALKSIQWGVDGRLVVPIGTDMALHQKWMDANGGGWCPEGPSGAWNRIGGDSYRGTPELVVREGNQVAIFAVRNDGSVEHRDGTAPNFSAGVNIGGDVDHNFDILATSGNRDRMDLFIVGRNGKVYHKKWISGQWQPSQSTYFDLGGLSNSAVTVAQTRNIWNPGEDGNTGSGAANARPISPGTYVIQSVSRPGHYLAHQNNGTVTLQQQTSPSGNNSLMWTFSPGQDGDYIITAANNNNAILRINDSNQVICSSTARRNITWNIDVRLPDTYVIGTSVGAFAIGLGQRDQIVALTRTNGQVQRWRISVPT